MKTVLLAWELGANLGHVGPLVRLARMFRDRGHRTVLALRDVVGPRQLLEGEDSAVLQAPRWPAAAAPRGARGLPAGYPDLLSAAGFCDPDGLAALVRSWDALFSLVRPDLVVLDHSPAACLAAYGTIPTALVCDGYMLPPVHGSTFPPHHPRRAPMADEARIFETVVQVQRRRGRPVPSTLPALFDAPVRAVTSFPQLDPYRAVRREPVIGPLEPMPAPAPLPSEPRLFAYLGDEHPGLETMVHALLEYRGPVEAFLRGDVEGLRRLLASRGARVHAAPPPLTEVLPRAAAVVSNAGSVTTHAALSAGRPQVLLPTHVSAELMAQAVEELGAGVALNGAFSKDEAAGALRRAAADPGLRAAATAAAASLAARPPFDAAAVVVDACLRLVS